MVPVASVPCPVNVIELTGRVIVVSPGAFATGLTGDGVGLFFFLTGADDY